MSEERCSKCGEEYAAVWYAPNGLWNRVNGSPNGFQCPQCFERECETRGVSLVWRAGVAGEIEVLEALRDKVRGALPDAEKLRLLAEWFDAQEANGRWGSGREVQDDLRGWADSTSRLIALLDQESPEEQ